MDEFMKEMREQFAKINARLDTLEAGQKALEDRVEKMSDDMGLLFRDVMDVIGQKTDSIPSRLSTVENMIPVIRQNAVDVQWLKGRAS